MSKIPTAEEFLKFHRITANEVIYNSVDEMCGTITDFMIEFARLHVQAALEAASYNACMMTEGRGFAALEVIDKSSIQEAYPLENIK